MGTGEKFVSAFGGNCHTFSVDPFLFYDPLAALWVIIVFRRGGRGEEKGRKREKKKGGRGGERLCI